MKKVIGILMVIGFLLPLLANAERRSMENTQPSMCMVTDEMRMCTGNWNGTGTMKDLKTGKEMPFVETLSIRPTLNNKYMLMESASQPDPIGNIFQGKGLSTYDSSSDRYIMYWFDTTGFGGKFVGTKQGNVLTYVHEEPATGVKMILTMTMDSDTLHHMTMQINKPGEEPVQVLNMTYVKSVSLYN